MSWASRRQGLYLMGVILFILVLFGIPALLWWSASRPAPCPIGTKREINVRRGPCLYLDEHLLSPHTILWSRALPVRDGTYNAVAYIQNSNKDAGVLRAHYKFGLYDARNVLITEREGDTFIMPGGITPVFEGGIDTGYRTPVHTYFEFTEVLKWQRMKGMANLIKIAPKSITEIEASPRLEAVVTNNFPIAISTPTFVAVVFDRSGNAIAASASTIPRIEADSSATIVFTWPLPLTDSPGPIDILPVVEPVLVRTQ